MAKDYAHHSRNKSKSWNQQKKTVEKKPFPWIAILLFLLLSAGLICSIKYLYQHNASSIISNLKASQKKPKNTVILDTKAINLTQTKPSQATPVVAPTPPPKIHFDFYTMLPQMKVTVAQPSGNALGGDDNEDAPKTGDYYILQVGSVTSEADAKKLQDSLKLEGFKAIVNPLARGDTTWYRIQIGPYSDYQMAQNAEASLQEQQLNGVILHMHAK